MMFPTIYTLLQGSPDVRSLFGARPRIYRDSAPQNANPATRPQDWRMYGVWQVVVSAPENTLSEDPSHERVACQLDVYGKDQAEVETAGIAVRRQLETRTHVTAWRSNRDPETLAYRVSLDFDYWLARES